MRWPSTVSSATRLTCAGAFEFRRRFARGSRNNGRVGRHRDGCGQVARPRFIARRRQPSAQRDCRAAIDLGPERAPLRGAQTPAGSPAQSARLRARGGSRVVPSRLGPKLHSAGDTLLPNTDNENVRNMADGARSTADVECPRLPGLQFEGAAQLLVARLRGHDVAAGREQRQSAAARWSAGRTASCRRAPPRTRRPRSLPARLRGAA